MQYWDSRDNNSRFQTVKLQYTAQETPSNKHSKIWSELISRGPRYPKCCPGWCWSKASNQCDVVSLALNHDQLKRYLTYLRLLLMNWYYGEWSDVCGFSDNEIMLILLDISAFLHYIMLIAVVFDPLPTSIYSEIPHITLLSLYCLHQICTILSQNECSAPLLTTSHIISGGHKCTQTISKNPIYSNLW